METTINKAPHLSFVHSFLGFGKCQSACHVHIWYLNDKAIVLLTDRSEGTSVTNASEIIINEIYNKYLSPKYKPEVCVFAETYGIEDGGIDLVIPKWENGKCTGVTWRHLGKTIESLLNQA